MTIVTPNTLDNYQMHRADEFDQDCVKVVNYMLRYERENKNPYVNAYTTKRNVKLVSLHSIEEIFKSLVKNGVVNEFDVSHTITYADTEYALSYHFKKYLNKIEEELDNG